MHGIYFLFWTIRALYERHIRGRMTYEYILANFFTVFEFKYSQLKYFDFLGITQEIIDKTRLVREEKMLEDLKELHNRNGDLEFRGRNGETPVLVWMLLFCLF